MAVNRELWNDYRATWEAFSRRLDELQALTETGDGERAEAAKRAVEQARIAHKGARDRLAAYLAPAASEENRVRETARLLWEFAGKPHGTAETDWYRAERLVRSASTPASVG